MSTEKRAYLTDTLGLSGDNTQLVDIGEETTLTVNIRQDVDVIFVAPVPAGATLTLDLGVGRVVRALYVQIHPSSRGTVKIGNAALGYTTLVTLGGTLVLACGFAISELGVGSVPNAAAGFSNRLDDLEETIDTAGTGLVDRVTALANVVTATGTGLVDLVGGIQAGTALTGELSSVDKDIIKSLLTILDTAGIINDTTTVST